MLFAENLKISIADYLDGELMSAKKHEYVNGDIYAMAGASEQHNSITVNLITLLHQHLRGTGCKVFASDMKTHIQLGHEDYFYYPDIQVCCEKNDKERYYKQAPKLIIEVLSLSTQRYDRSEKFHNYCHLKSLEEYVLISQDKQLIEIYRRSDNWQAHFYTEDDDFQFQSIDVSFNVAEVYEDVEIEPNKTRTINRI